MKSINKITKNISYILATIVISLGFFLIIETGFTVSESIQQTNNSRKEVSQNIEIKLNQSQRVSLDSSIVTYDDLPDFASIKDGYLNLTPLAKDALGNTIVTLKTPSTVYDFRISVTLPDVNFDALQSKIDAVIGDEAPFISYSISDFNRNQTITWQSEDDFFPASVTKIPYALLVLKDIDDGILSIDQQFPIDDALKAYDSDILYYYAPESPLSIKEYLNFMLQESDNTAMLHIENILGGFDAVKERIDTELDLTGFYRFPNIGTTEQAAKLMKLVYSTGYLSQANHDLLIDIMSNCNSIFSNRIVAGVPEGIQVTHKIGNLTTDSGLAVNDAGIIFGEKTDIIVIIMTKDFQDEESAASMIEGITSLAYATLN